VVEYFTDSIAAVALCGEKDAAVHSIPLGPKPQWDSVRRGEMLFHDGRICRRGWQSCATCHPDGRADALNWDLLNDGIGNPKKSTAEKGERYVKAVTEKITGLLIELKNTR